MGLYQIFPAEQVTATTMAVMQTSLNATAEEDGNNVVDADGDDGYSTVFTNNQLGYALVGLLVPVAVAAVALNLMVLVSVALNPALRWVTRTWTEMLMISLFDF